MRQQRIIRGRQVQIISKPRREDRSEELFFEIELEQPKKSSAQILTLPIKGKN